MEEDKELIQSLILRSLKTIKKHINAYCNFFRNILFWVEERESDPMFTISYLHSQFWCVRTGCKVSISSNVSVFMSDEAGPRRPGAKVSVGSLSTDVTDVISSEILDTWSQDTDTSARRQRYHWHCSARIEIRLSPSKQHFCNKIFQKIKESWIVIEARIILRTQQWEDHWVRLIATLAPQALQAKASGEIWNYLLSC